MHLLAQAQSSSSLVPVYYVVTILGILGGALFGLVKWLGQQRKRWTQEGQHHQRQEEALAANTDAARKNTEAIGGLTEELRSFVRVTDNRLLEQDGKLAMHAERLARVEGFMRRRERDGDRT
jgi:hypothetical protein